MALFIVVLEELKSQIRESEVNKNLCQKEMFLSQRRNDRGRSGDLLLQSPRARATWWKEVSQIMFPSKYWDLEIQDSCQE
jgi:hypothetical protein